MTKNTKTKEIIISAASIAAAANSVTQMDSAGDIIKIFTADRYADIADIALSSIQSEALVRSIAPAVARTVSLDDELLSQQYVEVAQEYYMDSTQGGGLVSCYSNCHSACHGSRGWR